MSMTVKELVAELEKFGEHLEVAIDADDNKPREGIADVTTEETDGVLHVTLVMSDDPADRPGG